MDNVTAFTLHIVSMLNILISLVNKLLFYHEQIKSKHQHAIMIGFTQITHKSFYT